MRFAISLVARKNWTMRKTRLTMREEPVSSSKVMRITPTIFDIEGCIQANLLILRAEVSRWNRGNRANLPTHLCLQCTRRRGFA